LAIDGYSVLKSWPTGFPEFAEMDPIKPDVYAMYEKFVKKPEGKLWV